MGLRETECHSNLDSLAVFGEASASQHGFYSSHQHDFGEQAHKFMLWLALAKTRYVLDHSSGMWDRAQQSPTVKLYLPRSSLLDAHLPA